jgi:NAD(P)-dependent dehydrogenase (short-subunit alcohol dehydrogenase family)
MSPLPEVIRANYKGSSKLEGKTAIITGGDSGIGRSVAVHFAREGADVAIFYLNEHDDAHKTKELVEAEGKKCILVAGDVGDATFVKQAVETAVRDLGGKLDILVNNAGEQHSRHSLEEITPDHLERVFRTNIFGYFYMAQAALKLMNDGGAIINTTSVTAYEGNPSLIDYSSTKGAIVAFTRSLSKGLLERKIRVNAVAPGPIWTPLIPASFEEEKVESFGQTYPMKRPAHPSEVGPTYVFLASEDSSFYAGQTLHPNGGKVVNG